MTSADLSFTELFALNALAYFDLFDYPLTQLEAYRYAYTGGMEGAALSFAETRETLDSLVVKGIVETANGLYFLRGRHETVDIRADRQVIADRKLKRAKRACWWLRFVPFLSCVAVCNNLGTHNVRADSDIDIFIVAKPGRLFLVRALVTAAVQLLGLRRHGARVTDRLCLSFYAAEDALDMRSLQVGEDVYMRHWIATVTPLYERGGYGRFFSANAWTGRYVPNRVPRRSSRHRRIDDAPASAAIVRCLEFLLGGAAGARVERWVKRMQIAKMGVAGRGSEVIISDSMLKFHENDRRAHYARLFEERIALLRAA